jgi:hypothetical protein
MKELLRKVLPFELKRGISIISVAFAFIFAGLLTKIGEVILTTIFDIVSPALPFIKDKVLAILFFTFEVNVLTLIIGFLVFISVLFPAYRYIDRLLLKSKRSALIFKDNFASNIGWTLNYWGTTNPTKNNRIENSRMIFQATPSEVANKEGFFGAFFDLTNGVYQGNTYEVVCFVKSREGSTMGFQLWLHDTTGNASILTPDKLFTPPVSGKEIRLKFVATASNAMRIHLHSKAGAGSIIVEKVAVYKIDGTNGG